MRIFDYIEDDEGRKKAVLNKKETAIAQSKQEMIKQEFQDWIWSDPERRERLANPTMRNSIASDLVSMMEAISSSMV
ncbi:MAG: hypothetical protein ACLU92_02135 [Coprococcus comes]